MATQSKRRPAAPERAFRDALGLFASGVAVAAADDGYRAHALTIASFCSVSLKPQLCLICVKESSAFLPVVRGVGAFSVHIMAAAQEETAKLFAFGAAEERLAALERRTDAPPRVQGALAGLDFELHAEHPGGDHAIIVGELTALRLADDAQATPALGWARGALGRLTIG